MGISNDLHLTINLNLPMPKMIPIKQKFSREEITDLESELSNLYKRFPGRNLVKPGAKIALAVGSRGIYGIDLIVKRLILELKKQGARPFIIPAMGSHGGLLQRDKLRYFLSWV